MKKNYHHSLAMLEIAANGIAPILNKVVFTGGAIVPLYAPNAKIDFRFTEDVDCVIEISNTLSYYKLERKLRSLGFSNDTSSNNICRWRYKEILLDIMPTNEDILGFSNIWNIKGMENSIDFILPSGCKISIFSLSYLIASKIEAYKAKGKGDFLLSKDYEDIIFLISYSPQINKIIESGRELLEYLSSEFKSHLENSYFFETIAGHFKPDNNQKRNVQNVVNFMNKIIVKASMENF